MSTDFGSTWDPFGTHKSKKKTKIDPALQAEIDAEQAANQRTALVRRRRRSSTLFGAGNRVLGSHATTPVTAGATALGGGGGGSGAGGGARSGGGLGRSYALR